MSMTGKYGDTTKVDAVEALLLQASPRPAPPGKDEAMIREAVQNEWRAVTTKHRTRTQLRRFAIAATVLLAVAASFNLLQTTGIAPVQVATISKSHGSIHLLGKQSELQELSDLSAITAGQTVMTDVDSGIGLLWGSGGSLRVGADTRVEFLSGEEIYLHSGQVYFDSTPPESLAGISGGSKDATLRILTDQGTVTHVGTQYMTFAGSDEIRVSVREGEVAITGRYHDERALQGQQLSISGSRRASVANFPSYGSAWSWIEDTAPTVDTDGRSIHEFLQWVGHETGLEVAYPDAATEQAAMHTVLNGSVDMPPRAALDFWLHGQDMSWNIDGGAIKVSSIDGSSGR